jgi:hypothetical protein
MTKNETYNKDYASLRHLIASQCVEFNDYVSTLSVFEKREFQHDLDYIIHRTKSRYRRRLYIHMILTLVTFASLINLKIHFNGKSVAFFIFSFGAICPATWELYKHWRTVRQYKLIKKGLLTHWFGEANVEPDDKEFFTHKVNQVKFYKKESNKAKSKK